MPLSVLKTALYDLYEGESPRAHRFRYGLYLHDRDAVHCKHCGAILNIPSDGDT